MICCSEERSDELHTIRLRPQFFCVRGAALDLVLVRGLQPRFHKHAPLKRRGPPRNVRHCHVLAVCAAEH